MGNRAIMPRDTLTTARKLEGMLVKVQPRDLMALVLSVPLLGCVNISKYKDPAYAQHRYEQAVDAVMNEKALACVADYGVFWVRNGDWVELGDDWLVVQDSTGKQHTLIPYIANPNCTPKE